MADFTEIFDEFMLNHNFLLDSALSAVEKDAEYAIDSDSQFLVLTKVNKVPLQTYLNRNTNSRIDYVMFDEAKSRLGFSFFFNKREGWDNPNRFPVSINDDKSLSLIYKDGKGHIAEIGTPFTTNANGDCFFVD